MKALPAAAALLLTSAAIAAPIGNSTTQHATWSGEVADEPLTPASPLDPLPDVAEAARRIVLPSPKGPVPDEAVIPFAEGGGTVTLLAPWRGGWLVGTNAGEQGGSLYIATPSGKIPLAKGNVLGGFTWRGHLYVLSGLHHLTLNKGELWEVDLRVERLVRRIPLPAMPKDVFLTRDRHLIVRTGKGDIALLPDGAVAPPGKFQLPDGMNR